jgi:zinc/manganese transport system substrate-binding protein
VSHEPGMKRRSAIMLLALAMQPVVVRAQSASTPRKLHVVASFSILADLLNNVGGDAIEVTTLVGPDADAHVFEPSPADARRLAGADLVVVNGLGFEGWLNRLVRASGYRGPVVVASAGIVPRQLGKEPDPHAWQDLSHTQRYVLNLRDALIRTRPTEAAGFQQRAAAYLAKLAALDADTRKAFAAIPPGQRRVITSHDAFGYFGAAYGLEFLAPQGMSTDSEASASMVAKLIEQIRRQGVRAVFVENITDRRLVDRIAREGGVALGGRLYSDALSKPGSVADTYLKLFSHNVATLQGGLQGRQPDDPGTPVSPSTKKPP